MRKETLREANVRSVWKHVATRAHKAVLPLRAILADAPVTTRILYELNCLSAQSQKNDSAHGLLYIKKPYFYFERTRSFLN